MIRVWLNNGSVNTTATNNSLIAELTIPVTTISAVAAVNFFEIPLNIKIPGGYELYVGMATAIGATAAAVSLTCLGTDL